MADHKPTPQIVISDDDARGAKGADEVSPGATLLPMLIAMLVLTVLGMAAVAFLV